MKWSCCAKEWGELQHQHLFSQKELSQSLWTHLNNKRSLSYLSLTRQTVKITATFYMAVLRVVGDAHCKKRELLRPVPSSKNPYFQNEAKCTTFLLKMSFISMRMKNDFHTKGWALKFVLIQRSGGRGGGVLGNGLLCQDTGRIAGCQAPGHPGLLTNDVFELRTSTRSELILLEAGGGGRGV